MVRHLLSPLLLFAAVTGVYGVTAGFEFLSTWDDKLYVVANEAIRGCTWANVSAAFGRIYVGNYAPLHILSYIPDYWLWGLEPGGYHLTNVLLHAANGILFYFFLRLTRMSAWQATAAAWIFLLHPVQVETVAWVSERKNLLAMFFFLGGFILFHCYDSAERRNGLFYSLSFLFFLAGVLTKSIVVVFPVIILLYRYCLGKEPLSPVKLVKESLPFFLAAILFSAVTIHSQAGHFGGGRGEFHGGSPTSTFFTMIPVLAGYLGDCFLPFRLSPFYMVPVRSHPDGLFFLAFIILLLVGWLGIRLNQRNRPLLFWLLIFFVFLLPVMQVVPLITLKHDRYLYFPLLGFAAFAVKMTADAGFPFTRFCGRTQKLVLACLLLSLPLLAYRQTLHWRNDISLWSHAVNIDDENRLAWRLLALGYTQRGDPSNAFMAIGRLETLRQKYGFMPGYDDLVKKHLAISKGGEQSGE